MIPWAAHNNKDIYPNGRLLAVPHGLLCLSLVEASVHVVAGGRRKVSKRQSTDYLGLLVSR